jgi:hypothetical protein
VSWGIEGNTVWGFCTVEDWLVSVFLSFPSPWTIAPLNGKYYGTEVLDSRGTPIMRFWENGRADGGPSEREKASWDGKWTPELWAEYCCDSHWESVASLASAEECVRLRNSEFREHHEALAALALSGRWCDEVYAEVQCGGPNRRAIVPSSEDMRRILGL